MMRKHSPSDYPVLHLSSAEETLAASIAELSEPAMITRADFVVPGPVIIAVSRAFCVMTGYDAPEILGRSPRMFQGPQTDRRVLDDLRKRCSAGQPFSGTTINYRKDGSRYVVHWVIDPIHDVAGKVTHFLALQRDLTAASAYGDEWLAAEERRHQAQALACAQMALIAETIAVLESTKRSFRSQELGRLRARLLQASRDWGRLWPAGTEQSRKDSSRAGNER